MKSPDFIVINDNSYLKDLRNKQWYEIQDKIVTDFKNKKLDVKKVIEYNGFYWHQQRFNGRTIEQYENDMIEQYKLANLECLIIWDFQIQKQRKEIVNKVNNFISV